MRGDVYEASDLVAAVAVDGGDRVQVPAAWLEEGSPYHGSYEAADAVSDPGSEPEPEAGEAKPKTRARRASDT